MSNPPATATAIEVRVTVGDTWMPRVLAASLSDPVAALKARALDADRIDPHTHRRYEVKVGGALVRDESQTLAACGIRQGAPIVILARRRRPVR